MQRLAVSLPSIVIAAPAVAAFLIAAAPAMAATQESLGSWSLHCPDGPRPACVLRHQNRLFDKAGLSADLEVRGIGAALVPAVAVRGLPSDPLLASALGDGVTASVQFPGGPAAELRCSAADGGYVCVPKEDAAAALAAALPAARSVAVRVSLKIPGTDGGPAQVRTLALAGTAGALERLRAAGVTAAPAPPHTIPPGFARLLDQALKAAGYTNGAADLPALLSRYLKRQ